MARSTDAAIIRIPANSRFEGDFVTALRESSFGRFYATRLKPYPIVRSVAIWAWRIISPVYLKYFVIFGEWERLVRFSDYTREHSGDTYTLIEPCVTDAPVPKVFPADDQALLAPPSYQYIFPKVQVAVLHDAIQYGGTNLVQVGNSVIHHDLFDFKRDSTSEELHGRTLIDTKRGRIRLLLRDAEPVAFPTGATFVDACAVNYAHWMTEVLPRIALFCADDKYRDVPIVVNDGLHKNIMESLFIVAGAGRKIITLPIGRALAIKKLYLTSATGYVPFDRRMNNLTGHSHGLFSPEALSRLSQRLIGQVSEIRRAWPENIYLCRSSGTRKIANAAELEKLLADYGYTAIEPEKLTFPEQVLLFKNAKTIIGPTGAAFANAIFCRPDAQVTVLMGKHESMIYRYWCNMLSPFGIPVNYILGNIVGNQHFGFHGDFEVALKDVVDLFEATGHAKRQRPSIHPSAQVSPMAKLGSGVEIGPFCIIHENVILGDRVKVRAYCELGVPTPLGDGSPLVIGDDALIRSHAVFYESSSFGEKLTTGHHVTVRENTVAGAGFQIGTLSEIQGDCSIGNYVRFQSNVFVGKKTTIGNYVWILPYVVLTNDPTPPSDHLVGCNIEDFASISAASVILPGVTVGHHALVAAQACVTKDVPPHKVVAGTPARVIKETREIKLRDGSGRPAYPWPQRFTRGYPDNVVASWTHGEDEEK